MSPSRPPRRALRAARVESFEARLLMSADSLDQLAVDYVVEGTPRDDLDISLVGVDDWTGLAAVRAEYGLTGQGQTVVIIDTGVAYDHVALGGGLGSEYTVVGGYDFGDRDANPDDDSARASHGTHVAGIIASSDPTYAGIAPGVDLVALKVFNSSGQTSFTLVEEALRWVHTHRDSFANPITTVNLSLGVNWNDDVVPDWAVLEEEFAQLSTDGIFVAVAAGNQFTSYNAPGLAYPAVSPYVVPVASVDPSGLLSYFSQRDDRVIAAPGRGVTSTVPDKFGNKNGVDDDFAKYSGTSMASPYVAGASVLLREACELVGLDVITPSSLYELMFQTADTIYDSITQQSYKRLNLERAIDAVLSADDFGSTAGAAHALGTVADTLTVSGHIGNLNDQDWFRFTAAQTGTITITGQWTHKLAAQWQSGGGAGLQIQNGAVSLDVVAGQTCTIGLGTAAGLGSYTLQVCLKAAGPATVEWGRIEQTVMAGAQVAAAGTQFAVTASQAGIFTVETLPGGNAASVRFQIYDAQNRLRGDSLGAGRADVQVSAGDRLVIRAVYTGQGAGSQVDFRLTNLVSQVGSVVSVRGTSGADVFRFVAGQTHQIVVNGAAYSFHASAVRGFQIDGRGGSDQATLVGTSAAETAVVRADAAQLRGSAFRVDTVGVENHAIQGGAGTDSIVFYDTAGNDTFATSPTQSALSGQGFSHRAEGFETVRAVAAAGGVDVAVFHDSAGNDTFVATTTYAKLDGAGFSLRAEGFDRVSAQAHAGGRDVAYLRDSAGNDTLVTAPTYTTLEGPGFAMRVEAFEQVVAYALQGGRDVARMLDSAGNDTLALKSGDARLFGQGFDNRARYFEQLSIEAGAGGRDTAYAIASGRTSRIEAAAALLRLLDETCSAQLYGFEYVRAQTLDGARCTLETDTLDYVLHRLS